MTFLRGPPKRLFSLLQAQDVHTAVFLQLGEGQGTEIAARAPLSSPSKSLGHRSACCGGSSVTFSAHCAEPTVLGLQDNSWQRDPLAQIKSPSATALRKVKCPELCSTARFGSECPGTSWQALSFPGLPLEMP